MERLLWTYSVVLEEEMSSDERFTLSARDPAVEARSVCRSGSADQYEEWIGRRGDLWLMEGFDNQRRFDEITDDFTSQEKLNKLALEDRASAINFGATYTKAVEQERANDSKSVDSANSEVALAALARTIVRGAVPRKPRFLGFVIELVLVHGNKTLTRI